MAEHAAHSWFPAENAVVWLTDRGTGAGAESERHWEVMVMILCSNRGAVRQKWLPRITSPRPWLASAKRSIQRLDHNNLKLTTVWSGMGNELGRLCFSLGEGLVICSHVVIALFP